ncbi:NAD-dependent protein deacetylase sirtuin-2 isoform X2 [Lathamus discolor]|uniref:NAD-dependent protein deacetylase sirtuin-2 isoform X2 n=1 Tax=Lathamus discolor TaxID=678569 RepID=UPI0032B827EB
MEGRSANQQCPAVHAGRCGCKNDGEALSQSALPARCMPGGVAVSTMEGRSAIQRCPRGARREVWRGLAPLPMAEADGAGGGRCQRRGLGAEAERDAESPVGSRSIPAAALAAPSPPPLSSDPPGAVPQGSDPGASGDSDMELLRSLLSRTLGLGGEKPEKVLEELTLEGVSRFLQSQRCRNVVCMVGAGISTAAGIPDFRSPGTGLYSNLQGYDLPYPEAIFEITFFKEHPEPFFALARELYPGQFKPTLCHYFMRLLQDKGLLLRCYTQNIDTLERVAGLEPERLVEAHGSFFTSHCLRPGCRRQYGLPWMRDIVFFGESLPSRFFTLLQSDFQQVDLLIIMGTSLQVQPFASLVSRVPINTPRLLINKEKTGQSDPLMSLMGFGCGMDFDSDKAYRDVAWLGECDKGCLELAELLGWKKELEELVRKEHAAIDAKATQGDKGKAVGGSQDPPPPSGDGTETPPH